MDSRKKAFAIQILRRATYRHPGRWKAEKRSRIDRGLYFCENPECGQILRKKLTELDHVLPVVDPLTGWQGFDSFIDRLFCEDSGYQRLCRECHENKTREENAIRKDTKNKKKLDNK